MKDADRWEARYANDPGSTAPNPFIVSLRDRLAPAAGRSARALDVAGGSGRHALLLAGWGYATTLVDRSAQALALARSNAIAQAVELAAQRVDLVHEELPMGPWDLVLCSFYLQRDLFPAMVERLKPGGWLVGVFPTVSNLERHASPSRRWLLGDDELGQIMAPLPVEIEICRTGWTEAGRHTVRLLARRR